MKKKILLALALCFLMIATFAIAVSAAEPDITANYTDASGLSYTVNITKGTASVMKEGNKSVNITDLVIPAEITYEGVAYPVVAMDYKSFSGNKNIKTVSQFKRV